jgi:hypothetical protein
MWNDAIEDLTVLIIPVVKFTGWAKHTTFR